MKYAIFFTFCLIFSIGCSPPTSSNDTNSNVAQNSKTPTPSPTISNEEREKAAIESEKEKKAAINDFLQKNFPNWKFIAMSNSMGECDEYSNEPCDLLIKKGNQEKVVAVMFKQFKFEDGSEKLIVFEARPIDLSQAKIEKIKNETKDNLTIDDIPDYFRQEIVESYEEY